MPTKVVHLCNKEAEIASMKTTLDLLSPHIQELIETNVGALRDAIASNHNMEMMKFEEVITHQKETNGRVTKVENELDKVYADMEYIRAKGREIISYQKLSRWIQLNPVKSIAIILVVLFFLSTIATLIDIKTTIALLK